MNIQFSNNHLQPVQPGHKNSDTQQQFFSKRNSSISTRSGSNSSKHAGAFPSINASQDQKDKVTRRLSNIDNTETTISLQNKIQQNATQMKKRLSEGIPNKGSGLVENSNLTKHNLLCPSKKESSQNCVNAQKVSSVSSTIASPSTQSTHTSKPKVVKRKSSAQLVMEQICQLNEKGQPITQFKKEWFLDLWHKQEEFDKESVKFLKGHEINIKNRTNMVDWMRQVFRVVKALSTQTFFISVSIMDSFLYNLNKDKVYFPGKYLYLLGVTSIYIATKFQEVKQFSVETTLEELAHNKFDAEQLLLMEQRILQTIGFRIPSTTIYSEAMMKLNHLISVSTPDLEQSVIDELESYISYLSILFQYDIELAYKRMEDLTQFIVWQAINKAPKFLKEFENNKRNIEKLKNCFSETYNEEMAFIEKQDPQILKEVVKEPAKFKNLLKQYPAFKDL